MSGPFRDAKAVFFDVDDTLYDFALSMEHAFRHLHQQYPDLFTRCGPDGLGRAYWTYQDSVPEADKLALIEKDPNLYRTSMWAGALESLRLDEDEVARSWLKANHPDLRFDGTDGFARIITAEFMRLRAEHWRAAMYPGATELLKELCGRVVLGAITNGPSPIQRPKLEAFRYRDFFREETVFVSGEFGTRKPDPRIFLAAAEAAGVAPQECVMVGDAREFDMPAKAVGFRTILFDGKCRGPDCSGDPYPPDAIARTYDDVRRLLGLHETPRP